MDKVSNSLKKFHNLFQCVIEKLLFEFNYNPDVCKLNKTVILPKSNKNPNLCLRRTIIQFK